MTDLSPFDRLLELFISPVRIELVIENWNQIRSSKGRSVHDDWHISLRGKIHSEEDIIVGETGEKLNGLGFKFDLHCKDGLINPDERDEQGNGPPVGYIRYYPPISSGDGVVDKKVSSLDGGGMVARKTMQEVIRAFAFPSSVSVRVWLAFKATKAPTERCLSYTADGHQTTFRWEKWPLAIEEIQILIKPMDQAQLLGDITSGSAARSQESVTTPTLNSLQNSVEEIRRILLHILFSKSN